ncbi:hypothetical protein [Bifidobacterium stellenboschense]|uniref:Uncharacterized protein n=1 Tax=Bifidobacterium stellenboschense TaxID=762211 RepID=A0A087DJJ3_9BIFI|nr:hypothetical protein [Bifidobacterium stellenboschense]KFI95693.1 hypothetical protein BSTEL_0499 [Bifidobacterium stellenboschense]
MQCMICGAKLTGNGRCLACERRQLIRSATPDRLCYPNRGIDPQLQHEWNQFFIRAYNDVSDNGHYTGAESFGPPMRYFSDDERRMANAPYELLQHRHWTYTTRDHATVDSSGDVTFHRGGTYRAWGTAGMDLYRFLAQGSLTVTEHGFYYLPTALVSGHSFWSGKETLRPATTGFASVGFSDIESAIILNWDTVQLEYNNWTHYRLITPVATLIFALYCLWRDANNPQLPTVLQVWSWV